MTLPDVTHVTYKFNGEDRVFASIIPPIYLVGIGAVITSWALFQMSFDNFLDMIRWNPELAKDPARVPADFRKRHKVLIDSISIALPNCPVIIDQVKEIATEAYRLALKRNAVGHSTWLSIDNQMVIYPSIDGTRAEFDVRIEHLFELAKQIEAVHHKLGFIQTSYLIENEQIPQHEKSALRDYFENNRPSPPKPNRQRPRRQPLLP